MNSYLATFRVYDDNLGLDTCIKDKLFDVLNYQLQEGNLNSDDMELLAIVKENSNEEIV
jgi:hypothetical protein